MKFKHKDNYKDNKIPESWISNPNAWFNEPQKSKTQPFVSLRRVLRLRQSRGRNGPAFLYRMRR